MNSLPSDSAAELEDLLGLITTGQLFAVQQWLASHQLQHSTDRESKIRCPLLEAVESGFHSMVEVLVNAGGWPQAQMDAAFDAATKNRRTDIAALLRQKGATMEGMDFAEVCRSMNQAFMEDALRNGCSPSKGNAFADVLVRSAAARPLLSMFRKMRGEFPELDKQAALAMAMCARAKKARATALLAWAGADPFMAVPYELEDDNWNFSSEEEWHHTTTAAECAVGSGKAEIVKSLKLKPNQEQARELLARAGWSPSKDLMQLVLSLLPDKNLNIGEHGSCPALESLVQRSSMARYFGNRSDTEDREAVACIEALLDAGARWAPPREKIRDVRRTLFEHDPLYVVRVVRLLLYTPGASDPKSVLELCRTPKARQRLHAGDPELWQELTVLARGS
jgi:hypothetical protein